MSLKIHRVYNMYRLPGVIWRINPKQCIYSLLQDEDVFSTKGRALNKSRIGKGTFLFAIASGSNRKQGILGVWKITKDPYEAKTEEQKCYIQPHKSDRTKTQWRVEAKKICDLTEPNLEQIKQVQGIEILLKAMPPSFLTMYQTGKLIDLVNQIRSSDEDSNEIAEGDVAD